MVHNLALFGCGFCAGIFCALFFSKLIDFIGGMTRKTKPKQPVTTTESCYKMCNLCRHYKPRGIVSVSWTCKEGKFGGNSKLCDLVNVARNCESFEHYSEHY